MLNAKLALVFVEAVLAPKVPLPNILLLLGVELLPNVKSGFIAELTFAEKLKPLPVADCCDDVEPNLNKEEFDTGLVSTLGLVDENKVVGVVAVPSKAGVVLFPKAAELDDPKSDGVALLLDGMPKVGRGFTAGELNTTGNFVSGVPKIAGLLSCILLPNVGIFSGMENPDGLLLSVVVNAGLSVPNAIVVFDSLLLKSDVELDTIGKSVAAGVSLVDLLDDRVDISADLFSPNDRFVDNAADDVGIWPKVGIVAD